MNYIIAKLLITLILFGNRCQPGPCSKEDLISRADIIFKKKVSNKTSSFTKKIEEYENYIIIVYTDSIRESNPLMKGMSGASLKLSKSDCKLIDLQIYQ